jgi:dUTPase
VHYGTIDSDYCGHEVKVTITNLNREGNIKINKGDRVAQLVVVPCHTSEWFTTKEEERTGGHGSTGE